MKIDRHRPPQKSEVADAYQSRHERRSSEQEQATGLGAAPASAAPTGLGNLLAAGLAGVFGVRRSQS